MRKKEKKVISIYSIFLLLVILSSCFLIYQILLLRFIETLIRYSAIFIIVAINIFIFWFAKKKKKFILFSFMLFIILLNLILCFVIHKVYYMINSIHKEKIIYSSSLITLVDKEITSILDVHHYKIGFIEDTLSIDNYIIAKEIMIEKNLEKDNTFIPYDDLLIMLRDLYNDKIDLAFVSSNYDVMFQNVDGLENIKHDTKVILEKDKIIDNHSETTSAFSNSTHNLSPFSVLLMGVDSEKDGLAKNAYANGDGLILITFNPETFNATMLSIPRDSYVPVSCRDNKKNKLAHVGWFGTTCMLNTIGNLFDISIDYYIKMNFKGVVGIVDALGGIEVDVPKDLCTDDSNRAGKICINKGLQILNGEQALVLARNRYNLKLGDIDRGYNQQLLLKSVFNKVTEIRDITTLLNIIETVSRNLDTNLTTEQILSFYNILKDILISKKYQSNDDFINIFQIKLAGNNRKQYFSNLNQKLWIYELEEEGIEKASQEIKINLEKENPNFIKNFNWGP